MKNSKEKLIICSAIILAVVVATIIGICVSKKTKQVASKAEADNNEKILINANEEIQEFTSIEDLEQEENQEETQNNDKKEENSKTNSKENSSLPYYIKVNYGAQVVTIYTQDENGEYTVPYKAMVCSTGVATPTSGVYSIPARWEWLGLQGDVYGHYSTQIKGNILFHSVPYLRRGDKSSLEYWEYDKLGTYASAGCIRLTVSDAKWIFNNCARGTKVEFYTSSNPGPLGKPSAKKISSYPDYLRNWDPTDPDSSNPWHTYNEQENNKKNEITNTEIKNDVVDNKNNNTVVNETNSVVNNTVTNTTVDDTNTIANEIANTVKQNVIENTVANKIENTKVNSLEE